MNDLSKLPRLYISQPMAENTHLVLEDAQSHYLKNVMRRPEGASIRLFNGQQGEWLATLHYQGKKSAQLRIDYQTKPQPEKTREVHLIFAPIKKDRMETMIEKAVELNVTHLWPTLTQQTSIRDINHDRLTSQIIEASEQCERMDMPTLQPLLPLKDQCDHIKSTYPSMPVFICLERTANIPALSQIVHKNPSPEKTAIIIGPEGGFSEQEKIIMTNNITPTWQPVHLGSNILRAETAAIAALSLVTLHTQS